MRPLTSPGRFLRLRPYIPRFSPRQFSAFHQVKRDEPGNRSPDVAPEDISEGRKVENEKTEGKRTKSWDGIFLTRPISDGEPKTSWRIEVGRRKMIEFYNPKDGGRPPRLTKTWLRDACRCSRCVDPSSGQKNFASADVPLSPPVAHVQVTEGGDLEIHWKDDFLTHDTHVSQYSPALWTPAPAEKDYLVPAPHPWYRAQLENASPFYPYASFMEDHEAYRQAMVALGKYGILFLRGVPGREDATKAVASKLGEIQHTFYGETWDVKSKPNAENVAYTNSYLGLHQDLLYMDNVPRIQVLHCLENTCEGGESLFADGYQAADAFCSTFGDQEIRPLAQRKLVYHYDKNGHRHRADRAVFWDRGAPKNDTTQRRLGIYWSPPFQRPEQADEPTKGGQLKYLRWVSAARRLKGIIESQRLVFEYKMEPGECVIFDNRRLLHGRRAFDTSSGERWLRGLYVDNDSFEAKLRSLELVHFMAEQGQKRREERRASLEKLPEVEGQSGLENQSEAEIQSETSQDIPKEAAQN